MSPLVLSKNGLRLVVMGSRNLSDRSWATEYDATEFTEYTSAVAAAAAAADAASRGASGEFEMMMLSSLFSGGLVILARCRVHPQLMHHGPLQVTAV